MSKENEKTIYDLELHESLDLEDLGATVIRVEEGWIYKFFNLNTINVVFVPYGTKLRPTKPMSKTQMANLSNLLH